MATDINQILKTLNSAGIQTKQPALYQAIKSLLDGTAAIQRETTVQFTTLANSLNNTFTYGLAADKANYKPQTTVGHLVFFFETDTGNLYLFDPTVDDWQPVGAPTDATYLTVDNETADLPNSRRLLEGTGIEFDDSVASIRTARLEIHPFLLMGA
jgi:hypothetical protein